MNHKDTETQSITRATWSGQTLPCSWVAPTLAEITFAVDKIDQSAYPEKQIKYIDISGIDNINHKISDHKSFMLRDAPSRARQILKSGDVLFSTVRPYLKNIAYVPAAYNGEIASTGFSVLRAVSGISSKYLFYFCLTHDFIASLSDDQYGVSYPAVKDSQVKEKIIPIPPLKEQTRIVEKIEELFSELDKGVESLKTAQQQLKVYRQALLKQAFEGKLTEQWRKDNPDKVEPAEQLLARIKAEREARYQEQLNDWEQAVTEWKIGGEEGKKPAKPKQSKELRALTPKELNELPELPKGWCWNRIGFCGDVQLGRQRSPKNHNGPHMRPYLRVANVFENRIDTQDVMEMNFSPEEFKTFSLRYGDILLNEGQSLELVGRPAMYRDEVPNACFQNTLVRFRPLPAINNDYALWAFLSQFKNARYQKIASWTTSIAHLGAGRFAEVEFPLCSSEEQKVLLQLLDQQLSVLQKLDIEIQTNLLKSEALRQSILKKAFSGQLVPQDLNDEPASELLKRIRTEREAAELAEKEAKAKAKKAAPKRKPKATKPTAA